MFVINLQLFANIAGAGVSVMTNKEIQDRWLAATKKNLSQMPNTVNEINKATSTTGAIGALKEAVASQVLGGTPATTVESTKTPIGTGSGGRKIDVAPITETYPKASAQAPAPAVPSYSAPTYNGMSIEELRKQLVESAKSGVNASADSQLSIIKQNLASALSEMESEKATGQANNESQLRQIGNDQFASTEMRKEQMNQAGWDMNNSGLAVGEVGKIGVAADQSRSAANANLSQILNDIARRSTLAKTNADTNIAGVEKVRMDQLSGVEAKALLDAENTGYSRYRDNVADAQWGANYNLQVAQLEDSRSQQKWSNSMAEKQMASTENQNAINNAWQKVNTVGMVDASTSKILGLPEGTSTLEANKLKLDSDLAIAGVTGVYDGKPTLAGKEFSWNTDVKNNPQLAAASQQLVQDKATFDEWKKQAPQRLQILNAQVKAATTANDIAALEKIAQQQENEIGKINLKYAPQEAKAKIDEVKASISNIYSQISTRKAELAISQQNANTAEYNAYKPGSSSDEMKPGDYKTNADYADDVLWVNQHPAGASAMVSQQAGALITKYGYDGYKELVKIANPKKTDEQVTEILMEAIRNMQ